MKKSKYNISGWLKDYGSPEIEKSVNNRVKLYSVYGQVYLLPYIKITHNKQLNGSYEFIIGWINKEIVIEI